MRQALTSEKKVSLLASTQCLDFITNHLPQHASQNVEIGSTGWLFFAKHYLGYARQKNLATCKEPFSRTTSPADMSFMT